MKRENQQDATNPMFIIKLSRARGAQLKGRSYAEVLQYGL